MPGYLHWLTSLMYHIFILFTQDKCHKNVGLSMQHVLSKKNIKWCKNHFNLIELLYKKGIPGYVLKHWKVMLVSFLRAFHLNINHIDKNFGRYLWMHVNLHEGLLKYMYITGKHGNSKLITNSHYNKVVYILPNLKHFVGCKKLSYPVITNQNLLSLELCCKHLCVIIASLTYQQVPMDLRGRRPLPTRW